MSGFLATLDAELGSRGVPARRRERILAEYRDHLACEPGSEPRLGDPVELARTFAAEAAAQSARRMTWEGFAALVLTAATLIGGQLAIVMSTGYARTGAGAAGWLWVPAVLLVLVAPQVALVAGGLGAWRAVRRRARRQLPDAEVALIRRRWSVANTAGILTCIGLLLLAVDGGSRLPGWWAPVQAGSALLALAALAAVRLRGRADAGLLPGITGASGGLGRDVPLARPLLARPRLTAGLLTALALAAGTALAANAEHSLLEGVERGGFEALVVAGGLAVTAVMHRRTAAPSR